MGSDGDVDDDLIDMKELKDSPQDDQDTATTLLANATSHSGKANNVLLADIHKVLSSSMACPGTKFVAGTPKGDPQDQSGILVINGKKYRQVNVHALYSMPAHKLNQSGSLAHHGTNGGVAGDDVCIINKTGWHVVMCGIDDHQIVDIPIVTAGAVISMQRGPNETPPEIPKVVGQANLAAASGGGAAPSTADGASGSSTMCPLAVS